MAKVDFDTKVSLYDLRLIANMRDAVYDSDVMLPKYPRRWLSLYDMDVSLDNRSYCKGSRPLIEEYKKARSRAIDLVRSKTAKLTDGLPK